MGAPIIRNESSPNCMEVLGGFWRIITIQNLMSDEILKQAPRYMGHIAWEQVEQCAPARERKKANKGEHWAVLWRYVNYSRIHRMAPSQASRRIVTKLGRVDEFDNTLICSEHYKTRFGVSDLWLSEICCFPKESEIVNNNDNTML
jgi:hypothetical protein